MSNSTLSVTSVVLDGGGWLTPRPVALPLRKEPGTKFQDAEWAYGPVWKGTENLTPLGIRSLAVQTKTYSDPADIINSNKT